MLPPLNCLKKWTKWVYAAFQLENGLVTFARDSCFLNLKCDANLNLQLRVNFGFLGPKGLSWNVLIKFLRSSVVIPWCCCGLAIIQEAGTLQNKEYHNYHETKLPEYSCSSNSIPYPHRLTSDTVSLSKKLLTVHRLHEDVIDTPHSGIAQTLSIRRTIAPNKGLYNSTKRSFIHRSNILI